MKKYRLKESALRTLIRGLIIENLAESDLDEEVLGEPDMSDDREEDSECEIDEMNTVASGNVRGYQGPLGGGQWGTVGVPSGIKIKKSKNKL